MFFSQFSIAATGSPAIRALPDTFFPGDRSVLRERLVRTFEWSII